MRERETEEGGGGLHTYNDGELLSFLFFIFYFFILFYFYVLKKLTSPHKLRGIGSDGDEKNNILLLDEAAFVPQKILNTIIFPLLKRRDSAFLTISTLGGSFDVWKRATEAVTKKGHRIFLRKTYSLVCEECLELGISDKCTHRMDILPPWLSPAEEEKVQALMANSKDDWLREAMGVEGTSDYIAGFLRSAVAYLLSGDTDQFNDADHDDGGWGKVLSREFNESNTADDDDPESSIGKKRKRITMGKRSDAAASNRKRRRFSEESPIMERLRSPSYPYVFIGVDPAAGGARSKYAVVSMVYERDGTIVVFIFILFIYA